MTLKLSDFALKGVKTFRGMEGQGFNANLFIKNKKIGFAFDDASGGPISVNWDVPCNNWEGPTEVKEFLSSPEAIELAKKQEEEFHKQYSGFDVDKAIDKLDLESLINYLFSEHMYSKDLNRLSKRYGFVFKSKNAPAGAFRYFTVGKDYVWTEDQVAKAIAKLEKEEGTGNIVILNNPCA